MENHRNGTSPALQSEWGRLSPQLIATFYPVKKLSTSATGQQMWGRDLSQPEVRAPITDGNLESVQNWQSPFENMGPDQKLSAFSALVQAGGFTSLVAELQALFKASPALDLAAKKAAQYEGRSNLTKLNSTQVFTGSPPMKITVTAHFRAFKNAATEVRDPMNQLMEWAVPQKIAADGIVNSALRGNLELYPSITPQLIAMKYADMLFQPLVIEHMPYPITGPRDAVGHQTNAAVTMTLATLSAWDKADWQSARV